MQQNNAQSLGEALRSLRHSQSLTQQELGERLGGNLDSRYVRRIESGARMPDRTMLLRLVAALGLRDRNAIDQMLELTVRVLPVDVLHSEWLAVCDPTFIIASPFLEVDLTDDSAVEHASRWWEDLTSKGGERAWS